MSKEKPKTKNRTLFYRRVIWRDKTTKKLEDILIKAHEILTTTKQRTFPYHDAEIQGMKIKHDQDNCFRCHVATYIPGQPTSLVPSPSTEKENNTRTQEPPSNEDFMEGDVFFLLAGDHIVICPSGVRESIAIAYISNVIQNAFPEGSIAFYSIEAIADINKVNLIRQEGVKKIILNSSLYEASYDYMERKTVKQTLLSTAAMEILALFSKDKDKNLMDIDKKENLSVRLEISYDSRKKGGNIGKKRIDRVANKIIHDDDTAGTSIITGTGKRVTPDEVRISEKVQIKVRGNSISRADAWAKLDQYLYDLTSSGLLEK